MNKTLTVLEAKRYGIYGCREEDSLREVSQRMVQEDVSALVVMDEAGHLAGLISQTDLVRAALLEEAPWEEARVSGYMSRQVVTVTPEATLEEVAHLLLDHCIHRVVVVQPAAGGQRPVGVVASSDLVYHMVKRTG